MIGYIAIREAGSLTVELCLDKWLLALYCERTTLNILICVMLD